MALTRRAHARFLVAIGVTAVIVATLAAPSAAQADRGNVDGSLKVGFLGPETGSLSAIIQSLRTATDLALGEINDAGGVLGNPVQLAAADDGTDPNVASAALDRLVTSDRVDAIIGPASSGTMLGIVDKVRSNGVVTCSGSTTAAELSTANSGGYFFRTAPPDRLQGPALAELVLQDQHNRIGLLVRNDSYGVGFARAIERAFRQSGGRVASSVAYNPTGTNFDGDVDRVLARSPDAVVVIGFNDDGAKVVNTLIAKGAGPNDIPIYTADGMQSSRFAATVDPTDPSKVAGIKGTAPAAAPAGIEHPFTAKFADTGVDPVFSSYYYDCTVLTALAAEKAESDDPALMRRAFASNLRGDVTCKTYAACREAIAEGDTVHYQGASSRFNDFGRMEPNQGAYEIWSYGTDGTVETEDDQITIGGA